MIALLKSFEFFRNNRQLSYGDYRELAQLMTFKMFQKDSPVYMKGEIADNFYVVLNGSVSEQIKNPIIDDWEWALSVYMVLQEWKTKEFDPKAKKASMIHCIKTRLLQDTRHIMQLNEKIDNGDYTGKNTKIHLSLLNALRG